MLSHQDSRRHSNPQDQPGSRTSPDYGAERARAGWASHFAASAPTCSGCQSELENDFRELPASVKSWGFGIRVARGRSHWTE